MTLDMDLDRRDNLPTLQQHLGLLYSSIHVERVSMYFLPSLE